jgi:hypothetical protein
VRRAVVPCLAVPHCIVSYRVVPCRVVSHRVDQRRWLSLVFLFCRNEGVTLVVTQATSTFRARSRVLRGIRLMLWRVDQRIWVVLHETGSLRLKYVGLGLASVLFQRNALAPMLPSFILPTTFSFSVTGRRAHTSVVSSCNTAV